jgi:LPXTG-site transpeptidase (sortase) family protein
MARSTGPGSAPWLMTLAGGSLLALLGFAGLRRSRVRAGAVGLIVSSHAHASVALHLVGKPSIVPVPSQTAEAPGGLADAPAPALPVELTIPTIGVHASMVHLGLEPNGSLQVPSSIAVAGWYTGSPRPGAVGSSVIAGHVDSLSGPGVFYRLGTLRPGDRVYVSRADGTMAVFSVTKIQTYEKDAFPTAEVYGPAPDPELRLITCGGTFDPATGHYLSNVVAYATLVP